MSDVKPTIVFAPGAWHTADCFDTVRSALHARDWPTEAIDYPSVGAEPPSKGVADDVAVLRTTLERLAEAGKKIVLVMHSYGGLVGANAVEGLGFKQRSQEGKEGGVIILVYLSAFVIPLGKSALDLLGGNYLPWMRVEVSFEMGANERLSLLIIHHCRGTMSMPTHLKSSFITTWNRKTRRER